MSSANQHVMEFDPTEESIIESIVRLVAAVQNTEITDLDPLANSVDTDLLERAVEAESDGLIKNIQMSFEWHEHEITVDLDDEMTVRIE